MRVRFLQFLLSITLLLSSQNALAQVCIAPRAPSIFVSKPQKPFKPTCFGECSDIQISSYNSQVELYNIQIKSYYAQLNAYAIDVDKFYKRAVEYIECMSN